jgi:Malectin domain
VRPGFQLLIAAGNRTYTDSMGRVWGSDVEYTPDGMEYFVTDAINGTVEDGLYQRERYGEFEYKIPVPYLGRYKLTLHFAEI